MMKNYSINLINRRIIIPPEIEVSNDLSQLFRRADRSLTQLDVIKQNSGKPQPDNFVYFAPLGGLRGCV